MSCGGIVNNENVLQEYEPNNPAINDHVVHSAQASTFGAPVASERVGGQDMRISIGSDHAGFELKQRVIDHLTDLSVEVRDRGTDSVESTDYPDHAHAVAEDVQHQVADLGIVICGSANGVNITANKHRGVRSAIAWAEDVARLAREHNDANVLALPARFVDPSLALRIVDAFLAARFEGGRHQRRVEKIEPVPEMGSSVPE